ncbi:hypothetical protein [Pedobacter aquatilis]|uniref:hypothetical protein n=1 Tax=Pedobacter aquatilis TaxID=351343 RepID=UPI00292E57CF|nr:hypothetical protein [Pedobacter aquatilis]
MKTFGLVSFIREKQQPAFFSFGVGLLLLFYPSLGRLLRYFDPTAALPDAGIWQLILLGFICFLSFTCLCWQLLEQIAKHFGLKSLYLVTLQFNDLSTWQQLGFYWASFALLFLGAIACLAAVL